MSAAQQSFFESELARHYETVLDAKGDPVVPSHEQLPRGTVKKVA